MKKQKMINQDPNERINNFAEVALGYSNEEAVLEANRCLQCKKAPCVSACPVNIDIPKFIGKIKTKEINEAYEVITKENLFPSICGRVCPQESQCESKCIKGIKGESVAIGNLERFVGDNADISITFDIDNNNKKVAVIGSGPSGLACASVLRQEGFLVTVFEALHMYGGVLIYGIPEFRLPKEIVAKEIAQLKTLGVEFVNNVVIGKTLTLEQLFSYGYEAIYIANGAGLPKFMNIEGENLNGVFSANEYLTRINLMGSYQLDKLTPMYNAKTITVVGGGNVAMDAARSAVRTGAKVHLLYRRTEKEMPARLEEIAHAKEEGIIFNFLTNPVAIIGDDDFKVKAIKCIKMKLSDRDETGRRRPVRVPGSEFIIKTDVVIMALGNYPNPLLTSETKDLTIDRYGCIKVNDKYQTSIPGVFAGGDVVTGAATVILAMAAGKKAAKEISLYLK